MTGYHVTKEQAVQWVRAQSNSAIYSVDRYADRHGQYPKECDHGVWNKSNSHWEFVSEVNEQCPDCGISGWNNVTGKCARPFECCGYGYNN